MAVEGRSLRIFRAGGAAAADDGVRLERYWVKLVSSAAPPFWLPLLLALPLLVACGAVHYALLLVFSVQVSALGAPGERAAEALFLGMPLLLFGALSRPPPSRTCHEGSAFATWALWARNMLVFAVCVGFPTVLVTNCKHREMASPLLARHASSP